MIQAKQQQGRNEKCQCGSGLKFKRCHGDIAKVDICNHVANERMAELIAAELLSKEKNNHVE